MGDIKRLDELLANCIRLIEEQNSWKARGLTFFELAPNIASFGEIKQIGKVQEWRATVNYGINLDEIEYGNNYFGATPEEAVSKALDALANRPVRP